MAEPGNKLIRRFGLFLIVLPFNGACADGKIDNVVIDNVFDQCIEISKTSLESRGEQLFLHTQWKVNKPSGECGCKSAAFVYQVIAGDNGNTISRGIASTLGKNEYTFLVNPDTSINYKSDYNLKIDCVN